MDRFSYRKSTSMWSDLENRVSRTYTYIQRRRRRRLYIRDVDVMNTNSGKKTFRLDIYTHTHTRSAHAKMILLYREYNPVSHFPIRIMEFIYIYIHVLYSFIYTLSHMYKMYIRVYFCIECIYKSLILKLPETTKCGVNSMSFVYIRSRRFSDEIFLIGINWTFEFVWIQREWMTSILYIPLGRRSVHQHAWNVTCTCKG